MKRNKFVELVILVLAVSIFFLLIFYKIRINGFLSFSDGAKFAIVARNLVSGAGYGSDFSFFSTSLFTGLGGKLFPASGVPVAMPFSIAAAFKIFGVGDSVVIATSAFYYVLLIIAVFLLGRKIYGNLVGVLSALAVSASINFLQYATSGASETLFSFLAVLAAYFLFVKKRLTNVLFFASLILLYLTRPQGVIFILALLLAWFVYNFSLKKGLIFFVLFAVGILFVDKFVLYPLSFKYPIYPVVIRGIQALFQYSPATAVSDALRGGTSGAVSYMEVFKKAFYNLYNFYKLLPDIASPYMWGLFIIGLFIWGKDKSKNIFNFLTIAIVIGSFSLAALTIPFYRYLHPVIPFVYVSASATLVWIVTQIFNYQFTIFNKFSILNYKISKGFCIVFTSVFLVLLLAVGQTLGIIFLDSRFERSTHNVDKPPVYVKLSSILRDNTTNNQIVVTNLDTWGSWYGQRKTVWFPVEPMQLVDPKSGKIPFDAIYLTNYLIDDENYRMGNSWRQIFDNPKDVQKWTCGGCKEIAKEFNVKGIYKISSNDNYERMDATAILLIKK